MRVLKVALGIIGGCALAVTVFVKGGVSSLLTLGGVVGGLFVVGYAIDAVTNGLRKLSDIEQKIDRLQSQISDVATKEHQLNTLGFYRPR